MQQIKNKFHLEDTLSQIYQNDYQCDSEYSYFCHDASFLLLNNMYIYVSQDQNVKIKLTRDYMQIIIDKTICEIAYSKIETFSIHFEA